jgi:hypothetical protein
MPPYIAYRLNRRWLVGDPITITADTDAGAIEQTQPLTEGCEVVELWDGRRLVAEIKSDET